jgi:predicted class III extradiol MEMO1 family dioxygenase
MDEEPEVKVEVEVETPDEPEPASVIVAPESGAVEDAIALVEHVEEDTPRWVENGREHEQLSARIAAVESAQIAQAVAAVEPIEEVVQEIVEEVIEEKEDESEGEGEHEIEMDVPTVEEEIEVKHGASWDVFEEWHNE